VGCSQQHCDAALPKMQGRIPETEVS